MAYEGAIPSGHRYVLSLSSFASPLTLRAGYRMFVDKSANEIVAAVLRDAGIADDQVVWRLSERYPRRPQCVQNGETGWAFVERPLADEGIAYWFDDKRATAFAGGELALGLGHALQIVSTDGAILQAFPCRASVTAPPAIAGDGSVFVGTEDSLWLAE